MAIEALDEAVELLFPYTPLYEATYDLYLAFIDGTPTKAQEEIMEALGVRY